MRSLVLVVTLLLSSLVLAGRNEIDRFSLMEDRIETDRILRPIGRDFFIDINGIVTSDTMDVISDAEDKANSNSVSEVQDFLNGNVKTEHQAFANIGLGFPLWRFRLFDREFRPSFKSFFDLGVSASIAEADPVLGLTNAFIQLYAKMDVKVGFNFNWFWDDQEFYYSDFFIHGLKRRDHFIQAEGTTLIANKDALDINEAADNSITLLAGDIKLGYRKDKIDAFVSLEELKLTEVSDNRDFPGGTNFGVSKAMLRLHGSYEMDSESFYKFKPFAGLFKRSYYTIEDTVYIGSEVFLWEGMFSAVLKTDIHYGTFTPRFRWGALQVELTYRVPYDGNLNGLTVDPYYGANLRLAF